MGRVWSVDAEAMNGNWFGLLDLGFRVEGSCLIPPGHWHISSRLSPVLYIFSSTLKQHEAAVCSNKKVSNAVPFSVTLQDPEYIIA